MIPMDKLAADIVTWLRDYATQARAAGYVIGLSGGIDSACTAVLCQRAQGEHVLGVLMPCHSAPEDASMAQLVATGFALPTITVDLASAYDALLATLPPGITALAQANIKARLRMTTLYALGQTHGYLVAGTGNKSELAIGYFTKYGDGGVDVEPLGQLYKWQVRQLARELGIPQPVIDRPPTAGLWAGQTDEGEMGITYDDLDATLAAIESGQTDAIAQPLLAKVRGMIAVSAHKRAMPPTCPL
ncbi:MAG: NAD(+) synthase [Anaerolineae bacterium]